MLHTNHLKSETRYFQVHDLEAKGSKILSRISCSTFITCFIEMVHVAKEQRKKESKQAMKASPHVCGNRLETSSTTHFMGSQLNETKGCFAPEQMSFSTAQLQAWTAVYKLYEVWDKPEYHNQICHVSQGHHHMHCNGYLLTWDRGGQQAKKAWKLDLPWECETAAFNIDASLLPRGLWNRNLFNFPSTPYHKTT